MSAKAVRMERVARVTWERREWHPVGHTADEMRECMEWVRSLGHEAKSLEVDGFRYRSVYAAPCEYSGRSTSGWYWTEPGEWLMHMVGEKQDPELDMPHGEGPGGEDFCMPGFDNDWHEVTS